MDFPIQDCQIPLENFSIARVGKMLEYPHGIEFILLDLQEFLKELQKPAGQNVMSRFLSSQEQAHFDKFTLEKRKTEWLGGRFAAKYVAAEVLMGSGYTPYWASLTIAADENGRPFLLADKAEVLPDISISHSGDLAAAMAVSKGFCGIDIQRVTDRVVKVRERFCTPSEAHLVQSCLRAARETQSSVLTRLWAAKEALRKVANMAPLPGFLELELTEITGELLHTGAAPLKFLFQWKHTDMQGNAVSQNCSVAVSLIADYALALTARNDTLTGPIL